MQYKDWSPDWWCLAHIMTSARARGRSNRLLTAAICNSGVAVVLTRQQDIWDYSFYAQRIVSKYARIFRGQLSDSGTQSKFGIRPVSIKRTNLQKSSTGKPAPESLTVMSVERSATNGQSPRLARSWNQQLGAAANCGDRTYRQMWEPNVNNNIYILTHEYSSTGFE